ncbi:hypothetical protein ES332_A12G072200v1 [Gossypium tomentosum]|uniref:Uncharacterized protein n=1 Tax=Gossypium tomentosum TaxID=34277 RepID=A0A5D2MWV0_GOSTO|nr:hypothetical protein ES332_A12G072200v1 [Gossypium tomentosum]
MMYWNIEMLPLLTPGFWWMSSWLEQMVITHLLGVAPLHLAVFFLDLVFGVPTFESVAAPAFLWRKSSRNQAIFAPFCFSGTAYKGGVRAEIVRQN